MISLQAFILLQAVTLNPADAVGPTGQLVLWDILMIVGISLVLATFLVFWAIRYVQRGRRRRHRAKPAIVQNSEAKAEAVQNEDTARHSRRRRRRRRPRQGEHREPRPTLAETGGLPPVRPPDSPSPPVT